MSNDTARGENVIRVAISTCPNDTFAFHGLMCNEVDACGLDFQFSLLDIQQLNRHLVQHDFDVLKASFSAAVDCCADYWVLPSGSALGFGVGPLLLAGPHCGSATPADDEQVTLTPGENTTATMLFRMFHPGKTRLEHVVFSDIMPRLQEGTADFGVCIHEGRFTYRDHGLRLVEDLGVRWEQATKFPLPLGGIMASKQLSEDLLSRAQTAIRNSIEYALAQPEAALPSMRIHAQEFSDEVLMQHVELYVNAWTLELGTLGAETLQEFSRRCCEAQGVERRNLEIWSL